MKGGDEIRMIFKHTPNGIIIPDDFLKGKAEGANQYVPREVLPIRELQEEGKAYSMGYAISPRL